MAKRSREPAVDAQEGKRQRSRNGDGVNVDATIEDNSGSNHHAADDDNGDDTALNVQTEDAPATAERVEPLTVQGEPEGAADREQTAEEAVEIGAEDAVVPATTAVVPANPDVNAAVAAVAIEVISNATRFYFEPELCLRLNRLNNHLDLDNGTATFHTVPYDSTRWGPTGSGRADRSNVLYLENKPLSIWSVAEIEVADLKEHGNWRRRPRIKFKPLLLTDARVAQRLYSMKACPVKRSDEDYDSFWASKWMGSQNDAATDVPPLDRVYDALDVFTTKKADMPCYTDKIKPGDIVLLELGVLRWAPRDVEASGSTSVKAAPKANAKKDWRRWNIEYRYQAMSVLYPGSDYFVDGDNDGDGGFTA